MDQFVSAVIILLLLCLFAPTIGRREVTEAFTMADCPNCFNRDQMQCYQCEHCIWCWTREGYGQCVRGDQRGPEEPYFQQTCASWQTAPDPIKENYYYLPGWRQWWWWTLSDSARDRLINRHNFPQTIVP